MIKQSHIAKTFEMLNRGAPVERRKHNRLTFSLPMECQVQLVDCQESWSNPGVLKNISLGGLYFVCESFPSLRRGDIGEFTLNIAGDSSISNNIRAKGQVKRVEHHVSGLTDYGVAIEFLICPAAN